MAKSNCALLLILLLMALVASPGSAQEKQEITQADLEWIVQNLDLIIRGQVTDVEEKLVAPIAVYGHGSNEPNMVITEVTMRISDVLAGSYTGNEIKFILEEGELNELRTFSADYAPMHVKVGDSGIVGIAPNTRGTEYNILNNRKAFFKIDGTNLIPYQEEYRLEVDEPLEIIEKKAKERHLSEIFRAADLVCLGTVTRLLDPGSPDLEISVSIDEILKGTSKKSIIEVDVSDVNRSFKRKQPGFQALLFLKKTGSGYKTVAGVNGYYVLKGEKLYRGFTQPFSFGISELKRKIEVWKEIER